MRLELRIGKVPGAIENRLLVPFALQRGDRRGGDARDVAIVGKHAGLGGDARALIYVEVDALLDPWVCVWCAQPRALGAAQALTVAGTIQDIPLRVPVVNPNYGDGAGS